MLQAAVLQCAQRSADAGRSSRAGRSRRESGCIPFARLGFWKARSPVEVSLTSCVLVLGMLALCAPVLRESAHWLHRHAAQTLLAIRDMAIVRSAVFAVLASCAAAGSASSLMARGCTAESSAARPRVAEQGYLHLQNTQARRQHTVAHGAQRQNRKRPVLRAPGFRLYTFHLQASAERIPASSSCRSGSGMRSSSRRG